MTTINSLRNTTLAFALILLNACGVSNTPGTSNMSWQPPLPVEHSDAGEGVFPEVAIDPGGNAMTVWTQTDGTQLSIWASRYSGGAWSNPELIETGNDPANSPHVAMDSSGNAVAVWVQGPGETTVWANRYTPGGGWGTARQIQTDNGSALIPRVAMDPAGNAIAVWTQYDGSQNLIRASRYQPGIGWDVAAALVDAHNPGDAGYPQVAMDTNGNAFAVWYEEGGSITDVWANRYTPAGGWGTPVPIENNSAGSAEYPKIAVGPAGNAIATWHQYDGTRNNIWINRYEPGTGWLGAISIDNTDDNTNLPEIAFDGQGEAIVAWQQIVGPTFRIFASRYILSHDWTTPRQISNGNDLAHELFPVVAMDGFGNGLVAWTEAGVPANIVANRFDAVAGWQNPALLEYNDAGDAGVPRLAMNAGGQAVAVWHQSDGIRNNIWAALFR